MSWFSFKKKIETPEFYRINFFPIFSELQGTEIKLVEKKIRLHEIKKGEAVYRRGELPESFYLILTGRFRVVGEEGEIINYLHPGDCFGETSILTNSAHGATIEAQNDSMVYLIAKDDFIGLVKEIPSLSLHISRTLGRRLMGRMDGRDAVGATKIISFCHIEKRIGCSALASRFAFFLRRELGKHIVCLRMEVPESEGEQAFRAKRVLELSRFELNDSEKLNALIERNHPHFHLLTVRGTEEAEKNLGLLLACLLSRYDYIVIDLPHGSIEHALMRKAVQQSDLVYFVLSEQILLQESTKSMVLELRRSLGLMQDQIRLIVREEKSSKSAGGLELEMAHRLGLVFATFSHVQALAGKNPYDPAVLETFDLSNKYFRTVRFLARVSAGRAVGLVLGSGAAFGYAHVGILKVLEEEKIDIDIVSASSMGAIIGCLWAAGLSTSRIIEILSMLDQRTTFFKLFGLADLSMVHRGFFKGDQVVRFLRGYLDDLTFRDLHLPVKVVATDLTTGALVLFDDGLLLDAIRASISIPGIFRPFFHQGRFLIDGGIADPLPVQVLTRYGIKKIIAVNVLQSPEDHIERLKLTEKRAEKTDAILRSKSVLTQAIYEQKRRKAQDRSANIFNVLMNTIEFMEYGMAEASSRQADITLRPVVVDAHWAEFFAHGKFVRAGEEEARKHIGEIRELIQS